MSLVTEKSLRFFVGTGSAQTKNFLDFDGRSGCDSQAKIAWSALCFNPPCQSKTVPLQTGGGEGVLVAQILLYLLRYKKGWFNKRDVYTLVLTTLISTEHKTPI